MEGWIKFETEQPAVGVEVDIKFSGRIIQSSWGEKNMYGETVWAFDPSGQVMPMWWRPIQDKKL
ncbi:hypothetical protein [Pseudomonas fluorescens]|uniref:Uncharacterized protein n=1 Tax=Pseudomonas fluorescens TaxID=294 RepID=A0A5E7A6R9_PSEFL|nr:hypothetical protein [Pseudomonas fluorescens]VVN73865.1 hypothetical protein PS710_00612 [Pseudomonas fluorescens]